MTGIGGDKLWTAYLNGDKEAFGHMYREYFNTLYQYGIRKCNNENLVKDAIHDLFVKLWLNRNKISAQVNIKPYLIGSFRNHLINLSIRGGRMPKTNLDEAQNFTIDFNAESELIKKENISAQSKLIIQALNQLTARQKEVIYLRFFEELSFEEIAELLNITVKGVYKLNYRALDALKLILNLSKPDILVLLAFFKLEFFK